MKPSPVTQPNILLILTDQQRFDTIQAIGSKFTARTPHMDALARSGVFFDHAVCTAPVCSPSRATLMTGLFPGQAGMPGLVNAPCPPLSPSLPSIGRMMRSAGYQTVYHGKWHLGGDIHEHGFEIAEECSHDESTRLLASRFWKDRDWCLNLRPFFQVVSFLNPHDHYFYDPAERVAGFTRPWESPTSDDLPRNTRERVVEWAEERWGSYFEFYNQLLERVDTDIGELLHQLRCSGFFSNTWIIFTSDHGDMAGEHDLPFKGPFLYEGVTRVPLVVVPPQARFGGPNAPGTFAHDIRPGRRGQLCSLLDVVPTIREIAGMAPDTTLLGRSLLPAVHDENAPATHEFVFASWLEPGLRMVRSRDWKYIVHESGEEELYHLAHDPNERRNLANEAGFGPSKESLRRVLKLHLESCNDSFPLPQVA
ncbi:sulfatase [soil metagenome]